MVAAFWSVRRSVWKHSRRSKTRMRMVLPVRRRKSGSDAKKRRQRPVRTMVHRWAHQAWSWTPPMASCALQVLRGQTIRDAQKCARSTALLRRVRPNGRKDQINYVSSPSHRRTRHLGRGVALPDLCPARAPSPEPEPGHEVLLYMPTVKVHDIGTAHRVVPVHRSCGSWFAAVATIGAGAATEATRLGGKA